MGFDSIEINLVMFCHGDFLIKLSSTYLHCLGGRHLYTQLCLSVTKNFFT